MTELIICIAIVVVLVLAIAAPPNVPPTGSV